MLKEIIIAGFGGQGVLYAGQVLAATANDLDMNVTWLPTYGPEVRGGTCKVMVAVDPNEPIKCQMVVKCDILVAMNKPSFIKYLPCLRSGGTVIINRDLVDCPVDRKDIKVVEINSDSIAEEIGNPKTSNMVALGALLAGTEIFRLEDVLESYKRMLPPEKQKFIPVNVTAVTRGYEFVSKQGGSHD